MSAHCPEMESSPKCTACRFPTKFHEGEYGPKCRYGGEKLTPEQEEAAQIQLRTMMAQLEELRGKIAIGLHTGTVDYVRAAKTFEGKVQRTEEMYRGMTQMLQEQENDPEVRAEQRKRDEEVRKKIEAEDHLQRVERRLGERQRGTEITKLSREKHEKEGDEKEASLRKAHTIIKEKYGELPVKELNQQEVEDIANIHRMSKEVTNAARRETPGNEEEVTKAHYKNMVEQFQLEDIPKEADGGYIGVKKRLAYSAEDMITLWHVEQSEEVQQKTQKEMKGALKQLKNYVAKLLKSGRKSERARGIEEAIMDELGQAEEWGKEAKKEVQELFQKNKIDKKSSKRAINHAKKEIIPLATKFWKEASEKRQKTERIVKGKKSEAMWKKTEEMQKCDSETYKLIMEYEDLVVGVIKDLDLDVVYNDSSNRPVCIPFTGDSTMEDVYTFLEDIQLVVGDECSKTCAAAIMYKNYLGEGPRLKVRNVREDYEGMKKVLLEHYGHPDKIVSERMRNLPKAPAEGEMPPLKEYEYWSELKRKLVGIKRTVEKYDDDQKSLSRSLYHKNITVPLKQGVRNSKQLIEEQFRNSSKPVQSAEDDFEAVIRHCEFNERKLREQIRSLGKKAKPIGMYQSLIDQYDESVEAAQQIDQQVEISRLVEAQAAALQTTQQEEINRLMEAQKAVMNQLQNPAELTTTYVAPTYKPNPTYTATQQPQVAKVPQVTFAQAPVYLGSQPSPGQSNLGQQTPQMILPPGTVPQEPVKRKFNSLRDRYERDLPRETAQAVREGMRRGLKYPCFICPGEAHEFFACQKFLETTNTVRHRLMRRAVICSACLSPVCMDAWLSTDQKKQPTCENTNSVLCGECKEGEGVMGVVKCESIFTCTAHAPIHQQEPTKQLEALRLVFPTTARTLPTFCPVVARWSVSLEEWKEKIRKAARVVAEQTIQVVKNERSVAEESPANQELVEGDDPDQVELNAREQQSLYAALSEELIAHEQQSLSATLQEEDEWQPQAVSTPAREEEKEEEWLEEYNPENHAINLETGGLERLVILKEKKMLVEPLESNMTPLRFTQIVNVLEEVYVIMYDIAATHHLLSWSFAKKYALFCLSNKECQIMMGNTLVETHGVYRITLGPHVDTGEFHSLDCYAVDEVQPIQSYTDLEQVLRELNEVAQTDLGDVQEEVGGEEVVLLVGMERVDLQPRIREVIGGRTAVAQAPFKDVNGKSMVLGGTYGGQREIVEVSPGEWENWHKTNTISFRESWSEEDELGEKEEEEEVFREEEIEKHRQEEQTERPEETREAKLARKMFEDLNLEDEDPGAQIWV